MSEITRQELREVLIRWGRRDLSMGDVYLFAEAAFDAGRIPYDPAVPADPIAAKVALQLNAMPITLVTRDDIPFLLEFLKTRTGEEDRALRSWADHWAAVDYRARKTRIVHPLLKHNE